MAAAPVPCSATLEGTQHAPFACSRSSTASQLTRLRLLSRWHSTLPARQHRHVGTGSRCRRSWSRFYQYFQLPGSADAQQLAARSPTVRFHVTAKGSMRKEQRKGSRKHRDDGRRSGPTLYYKSFYAHYLYALSCCVQFSMCCSCRLKAVGA